MRPSWLIEADVYGAAAEPLFAEVRRQGMACRALSHRELIRGVVPEVGGGPLPGDACVVSYGTFPFVRHVQLHRDWVPGAWCDPEALDCAAYYAHFGKYLLGGRYAMMPGVEAVRQRAWIYGSLARGGRVFVRPAGCHKLFVGRCVAADSFADALAPARYDPETLVVVAEPRAIAREWRLVVAGSEVIAASQYARDGAPAPAPGCPDGVRAFVVAMLADVRWRPDPIFMVDVGEADGGLALVELNGFSCSWLYRCDFAAVVARASDLASRAWEGRAGV
jgi:hypothetical protein